MKLNQEQQQALQARFASLDAERNEILPHWRELQDFISPHLGIGLTGSSEQDKRAGKKFRTKILNNQAGRSKKICVYGLKNGLTSESKEWFNLGVEDPDLNDYQPAKEWLYTVECRMRSILSQSNFYRVNTQIYDEVCTFGPGVQISEPLLPPASARIRFIPLTAGEYWIACDYMGSVNTLYRRLMLTAAQMVGQFGLANVTHHVAEAFRSSRTEQLFPVIQALEENDSRVSFPELKGFPFRSIYFEEGRLADGVLAVGGYMLWPVQCPRWETVGGSVYGQSVSMELLPEVKELQKTRELYLKNAAKNNDPPVTAKGSAARDLIYNFDPGGVNIFDDATGAASISAAYQVNNYLGDLANSMADLRAQIREGYFNDLFAMLSQLDNTPGANPQKTAAEIYARQQEKMDLLGPVVYNLVQDYARPTLDALFYVMASQNLLPPAPPEMQGQQLKIEFVSPLAIAQRSSARSSIMQLSNYAMQLGQINPEALDKFNMDAALDAFGNGLGVPPTILRDTATVAALRKARAEAAAQQQQVADNERMSATAKNLGQAQQTMRGGQ